MLYFVIVHFFIHRQIWLTLKLSCGPKARFASEKHKSVTEGAVSFNLLLAGTHKSL
jgi:hypothetical protein